MENKKNENGSTLPVTKNPEHLKAYKELLRDFQLLQEKIEAEATHQALLVEELAEMRRLAEEKNNIEAVAETLTKVESEIALENTKDIEATQTQVIEETIRTEILTDITVFSTETIAKLPDTAESAEIQKIILAETLHLQEIISQTTTHVPPSEKLTQWADPKKNTPRSKISKKVLDAANWARHHIKTTITAFAALTGSVTMVVEHLTPEDIFYMAKNWSERHIAKSNIEDPALKGIDELFNSNAAVERATYDYLGKEHIPYKGGYYSTLVLDLSDRTPPRFTVINGRENRTEVDSTLGLTTNLFKQFYPVDKFKPELPRKEDMTYEQTPVIAYNTKTQTIKAGVLGEFTKGPWLISETFSIPLNFQLDSTGKLPVTYHGQALRQVPITVDEKGRKIPFPIGVSANRNVKSIDPKSINNFGVLEGGKVIMTCGPKQVQVNGGFADIYKTYEKLKRDFPNQAITAYLLDNGSYNLPIMQDDHKISKADLTKHFQRNRDGGTTLALMDDMRVSPFEYKNKYPEEYQHTENYRVDTVTGKEILNEKKAIVLHHTGEYKESEAIFTHFKDPNGDASAHVVILKNGKRVLFNTDNHVLWHAGKSLLHGREDANAYAIGVELEGDSHNGAFTVAQMESLVEYLRPRIEKYNIGFEYITDHATIRDNYRKAHPDEKGVLPKRDLDEKIFQQLQHLIKKKIYDVDSLNGMRIGPKVAEAFSERVFLNQYRTEGDALAALETTKRILGRQGIPTTSLAKLESKLSKTNLT